MKTLIVFFAIFTIQTNYQKSNYPQIFGNDYKNAISFFKTNKKTLKKGFQIFNVDLKIASSIVFPEKIRYSIVKDFFETAFLEVFYVENGSSKVDFSIGDFQIKPSFAEKIEFFVKNNLNLKLKYKILINYYNNSTELIRKERVRRLKKLSYQIIYISAFYDIIKIKFYTKDMTKKMQLKFFATAYNFGFDKTQKDIIKHINYNSFPYGNSYPGKQYSYSNISYYFYNNEFYRIFKE